MKKEVILMPKGKIHMDFIKEICKERENICIFLNRNIVDSLMLSDNVTITNGQNPGSMLLKWDNSHEKIEIQLSGPFKEWKPVNSIDSSDIFYLMPEDPEELYFLQQK